MTAKLMDANFSPTKARVGRIHTSDKYGVRDATDLARQNPGTWVRLGAPVESKAQRYTLASNIRKGRRSQIASGEFEAATDKNSKYVYLRLSDNR